MGSARSGDPTIPDRPLAQADDPMAVLVALRDYLAANMTALRGQITSRGARAAWRKIPEIPPMALWGRDPQRVAEWAECVGSAALEALRKGSLPAGADFRQRLAAWCAEVAAIVSQRGATAPALERARDTVLRDLRGRQEQHGTERKQRRRSTRGR